MVLQTYVQPKKPYICTLPHTTVLCNFFSLKFIHRIIDIYLDTLLQTYIWYIKCAGKREDKVAIKFLVDISEMRDEVIVTEKTKAPVSKTE